MARGPRTRRGHFRARGRERGHVSTALAAIRAGTSWLGRAEAGVASRSRTWSKSLSGAFLKTLKMSL